MKSYQSSIERTLLGPNPQISAMDPPMGQKLRRHPSGRIGRDSKADPLGPPDDRCVNADNSSPGIHQRASGVPGLRGAVCCTIFSMSLPCRLRKVRPTALTTPVDTVDWNPRGLPMAMINCPTRNKLDSPNAANGSPELSARITARSVAGSTPTRVAGIVVPFVSVTDSCFASCTT